MEILDRLNALEEQKQAVVTELTAALMDTTVDLDVRWKLFSSSRRHLPHDMFIPEFDNPAVNYALNQYLERGLLERHQEVYYTNLVDHFSKAGLCDEYREEVLSHGNCGFIFDW